MSDEALVALFGVLVTLVLTSGSIFYLAKQTKAAVEQAKAAHQQVESGIRMAAVAANDTVLGALREIHLLMIERPALRPYFYGGKPCPENDPLCAEVVTVGELLADIMNQGIVTHEANPQSTSADPWDDYCRTTLASSPVLRELIATHPKWWPDLPARCPTQP
ncbi:hypothetical protein ABZT34_37080 [Streptomyces sp. NPDC005329]|uniref:hypothetical protein n=1 Tax=Streptomyces sp. NPDC005329 TaxID=3157034 RepID=UPI0033B4B432